jgi:hypothetical protein
VVTSTGKVLSQGVGSTTTTTTNDTLQRNGSEKAVTKTGTSTDPMDNLMYKFDIDKNPGEVAFFKTLHCEAKSAALFFDKTKQELKIREERIRMGFEILKQVESYSLDIEKWVCMSKSVYKLYKDLLLLETYAIMTYCGFSKILKKHDKNTGYSTQAAFMRNVVDKLSFAAYPDILNMIQHSEVLYEVASKKLVSLGKAKLDDDERLFLDAIVQLNQRTTRDLENDNINYNSDDEGDESCEGGLIIGPAEESPSSSSPLIMAVLHSLVTNSLRQNTSRIVSDMEGRNEPSREEDSGRIRPDSAISLKRASERLALDCTSYSQQAMKKRR